MSCPNCSHSMEAVGGGLFWCPRCGTQKGDGGKVWTPKLVERCRLFARNLYDAGARARYLAGDWQRFGIAESICPEGDRALPSARDRG